MQKIDSSAVNILHKIFPKLFFSLISVNPTIDLAGDPFETASSSMVKQMKKIIRNNVNQLRFEVFTDSFDEHMKTMFKLHEKSSKKMRSMDIFAEEKNKIYYTKLTKNFPQAIRLFFLYFNNVPIAYQYGFFYRNIFTGDQIAYHNDYTKLRPGKLIVYHIIEHFKKHHASLFDQGGGISEYKMEFTKDYRFLYNVYYSPNKSIMIWWKLINVIRRKKQMLFPKKFTRDNEFLFKTL